MFFFSHVQHMPPPLPSKTPPPPPPKTTRKQASVDSGIVQWAETPAVGPKRQQGHHPVIPTPRWRYQCIPHACSQADQMNTSPFVHVSRKWIPTCCLFGTLDFAFRGISLDQQLSDFHFKGESLSFFPHYVQRIVYMILFYFWCFVCGLMMTSFVLRYQRHYIQSG